MADKVLNMQENYHQHRFLPKTYCSWLKPNGEFIESETNEHIDYLKINAKHIHVERGNENYIEAMEQFMRETKWIRVRGYSGSKQIAVHGIKPFTKDQRNTIKDLEIFGYVCIIQQS